MRRLPSKTPRYAHLWSSTNRFRSSLLMIMVRGGLHTERVSAESDSIFLVGAFVATQIPTRLSFARWVGMLADEHNALAKREVFVGPVPHRFVERCLRDEHGAGSSDHPANVERIPVPQLYPETHVGNVVQIWVLKLPQQFVHALVEAVVRPSNEVRFGAQSL